MKAIIFGATGMVGQGVLRECLLDRDVAEVLVMGRAATGVRDPKLREIVLPDVSDIASVDGLAGYDACFFCLGVSSVGMKEADYRRITYDLTLAVGRILADSRPDLVFVYVSGQGTDSSEHGRSMWARIKGKTENDLLALPFRAYMFRPGYIQPMHGAVSKVRLYRLVYVIATPIYSVVKRLFPGAVTSTEQIGRAMLAVARTGAPKRVLETADINAAAAGSTG